MSKPPPKQNQPTQPDPEVKSLGLYRRPEGWVVVQLVTQGDRVIARSETVPDLRALALEQFRLLSAKEFMAP